MNAPFPPFPANPRVGQVANGYCWNGSTWVPSPPTVGQTVSTQVFTASGTYMPSPGLTTAVVECIGGGGGGGGVTSAASTSVFTGGGGGSGGYSRKACPAALVMGGVVVTIGAGGAQSNPGGATSFGALCVANGGSGGIGTDGTTLYGAPGVGATPGIGDVAFAGSSGFPGQTDSQPVSALRGTLGGAGGQIFGGNITAHVETGQSSNGFAGYPGTGAGGSGAAINQLASAPVLTGGAGGSGICIVTEYCWAQSGAGACGAPMPLDCGPGWGGPC